MGEKVVVWFEGLGLDRITLNKVAVSIGDVIEVRWYGILITLGIVLAFLYTIWRGKRNEGFVVDNILDVGISTVICGVVGARLYYVLTSLDQFPTFWSVFEIWNGGIGIYGGIIGGCIGIWIAARIKRLNWRRLFDAIAPGVMLAQAVGRWGNFFNGEAHGYAIGEKTKFYFFLKEFEISSGEGTFFNLFRMGLYPSEYSSSAMVFVHPTFLYECVWNLIGFVIINLLYKKKKFDGQVALMYIAWYGFGRMFIEGLRTDSLYIFKGLLGTDGIRISQLVGLLCFVGGLTAIIVLLILCKKHPALCRSTANGAPIAEETVEETAEEIVEECVPAEEAAEEAEIDEWEGFDDEPDGEIDELTDLENAEDAEAAEVLREEALLEGDADTDADFEANDGKQNETEQKDEETKHGNEN